MPAQVPLPFAFHDTQDFDSYFPGPNRQVFETLKALAEDPDADGFLLIRGDPGLGKTHLLQASCKAASRLNHGAFYVPFRKIREFSPDILEGLESYALVCVDDIDMIAGIPEWETAFFHFFNRHKETFNRLAVSSTAPLQRLAFQLPDLASRLRSGLRLELKNLSDSDKLEALTIKANRLGINLPAEVGRFLLSRYPRDLPNLWRTLETLDYASLSEQRKLTIPFLKSHLPQP